MVVSPTQTAKTAQTADANARPLGPAVVGGLPPGGAVGACAQGEDIGQRRGNGAGTKRLVVDWARGLLVGDSYHGSFKVLWWCLVWLMCSCLSYCMLFIFRII